MVGSWIAARPLAEVLCALEEAEAAVAPIYDVRDVMADPQFQAPMAQMVQHADFVEQAQRVVEG